MWSLLTHPLKILSLKKERGNCKIYTSQEPDVEFINSPSKNPVLEKREGNIWEKCHLQIGK